MWRLRGFCVGTVISLLGMGLVWFAVPLAQAQVPGVATPTKLPALDERTSGQLVTMDFNQVDLPTFIKFVSELTQQNFAIDDRVKGKVTIYAPRRIPVGKVYGVFEQILSLKGFGLVPAEDVIQVLPLTDMPPSRNINVYYLQNANATEMAKVLTGIVSRSAQSQARRPVRGRAAGGRGGQEFEGVVQVLADGPTNSLIITASGRDYKMIQSVLAKLDIKRRQVYVEAVILEVTLDDSVKFGVNLFGIEPPETGKVTLFGGSSTIGNSGLFQASELAGVSRGFSGLSVGSLQEVSLGGNTFFNVGALLQALASDGDINVLSTPQILTSDNQKAEIVVGENIPILTSRGETTGGNFNNQIERKDIGITLRFTPQILESDLVKLELYQEISGLRSGVSQDFTTEQGVITSKKSASTTVIVKDKQTVVIGGLIEDKIETSISKVPILGDIPLLGWLFRSTEKVTKKSNLMIFLTPHVIRDPNELYALQQTKSLEMIGFIEDQKIDRKEGRIKFLQQAINPPE